VQKSTKKSSISGVSERILHLADYYKDYKGINNKNFMELCGLHKNVLTTIKAGTVVNVEMVANIAKNTHCNSEWLLTGKGEMYDQTPTERINAMEDEVRYSETLTSYQRLELLNMLMEDEKKRLPDQDEK
jgi:hypothetical protein